MRALDESPKQSLEMITKTDIVHISSPEEASTEEMMREKKANSRGILLLPFVFHRI